MRLPNPDRAIVDDRKLQDYCLSQIHRHGKFKARLFSDALGLTVADAGLLKATLLEAVRMNEAVPTRDNGFGQIYEVEFEMTTNHRHALVLSVWIVLRAEDFPRLVTCYPI